MPESELDLLITAVEQAGHTAARFWRRSPRVWQKGDNQGPVSEADIAVNEVLKDILLAARPDYGWLSEEDDPRPGIDGRTFIVDPIDGTRAYLESERAFAHSVAIVDAEGRVETAVVFLPLREKLYAARRGAGAQYNGQPIGVSTIQADHEAEVLMTRPTLNPENWAGPVPGFSGRQHRPSLAYRMCLVAQGKFDALLTLRDSWHWDIAAGSLIAQEAGARVTDRHGAPIRFGGPRPVSSGLLVANPDYHGKLRQRLATDRGH